MRMQLDKGPFGSTLELNPLRQPGLDTTSRSGVNCRERRVVDAQPELVRATRQRQGPLDHQNAIVHDLTDTRPDTLLVCARAGRIAGRPIDLIDDVWLR